MTEQTMIVRFAATREQSHAAAIALHQQGQVLIGLGKRVKYTVEEAQDELSIRQRGFLHKAVFPQISEQVTFPDGTRFEWRVWKEMFRARFLGDRYVLRAVPRWDAESGKFIKPKRKTPHRERVSSEDLGVRDYSKYIDTVIDTAVTEFGVTFRFIAEEREGARYVAPVRKAKAQQPEEAAA